MSDEAQIDNTVQSALLDQDDVTSGTAVNDASNDASNDTESTDPKSPLEQLKDRITARLLAVLDEKPSYYFEEDQTVYLKDQSTEDLDKLFFGKVHEYEQEVEDQNDHYYYDRDKELCKDELSTLIDNEFNDEISALAESLEQDPCDLEDELKKDDDFTPSELGWNGHFTKFSYCGEVTVTADINLASSAKPCAELFATLHALRITPKAFLKAVKEKMAEEDAQLDDHEKWGMNAIDGNGKSIFHAYRAQFNRAISTAEILQCLSFDFSQPPVVDVDELVDCMSEKWSGQNDLKITMALDDDMVEDFSRRISCHYDGKERDNLRVMATHGYIGVESRSYVDTDAISIISPISVPLSSLRTLREQPDRDMDGGLELHSKEAAYTKLYKLAHQNDPIPDNQRQSETQLASLAAALSKSVSGIIADLPGHAIERVRSSTSGRTWGKEEEKNHTAWVNEEVVRQMELHEAKCLSVSKKEMGRALLSTLNSWATRPDFRDEALWLIRNGADVNLKTTNGFSAMHFAARLNDVDLMARLANAGADINVKRIVKGSINEETPLSFAVRHFIGYIKEPVDQCALGWLLDKEVAVSSGTVLAKNGDHSYGHIMQLAFSGGEGMAGTFERVLRLDAQQSSQEDHQKRVDTLFKQSVYRVEPKLGAVLIDAGAKLDFKINLSGKSDDVSPETALRQIAEKENEKSWKDTDRISRANDFAQMIMSVRAKQAIDAVIKKAASARKNAP